MGKLLLGIDVGTSSIKVALFHASGETLVEATQAVPILNPEPEFAEQDMNAVWESTCLAVRQCLSRASIVGENIAAVGVSGQGTGCWLLDRQKNPLSNAIIWIDGRAKALLDEWKRDGKVARVFALSSNSLFTGSPVALLAWLKRNRPEDFRRVGYFLFAKDWVRLKLTGVIATDSSDLSMFPCSVEGDCYEILEVLDMPEVGDIMPSPRKAWEVVGEVMREAAEVTGIPVGTPVVTGLVDVASCALALGVVHLGQVYSILGTTSFNAFLAEKGPLLFQPQGVGISVAYLFPNTFLRAMATMSGTLSLDWFLERFFGENRSQYLSKREFFLALEKVLEDVPPGAEGVMFLPYISPGGERAPFLNPHAQGVFFGLRYNHTKAHLLRAVYEGVAFSVLDCFQSLKLPVSELRFCGGGAKSDFWCQLIADVLNARVIIPKNQELGALGAALLAGVGAGVYRDVYDAVERTFVVKNVFEPRERISQFYRERFAVYRELRESLKKLWVHNDQMRYFLG
nr:FGGY-family carbohydrate kinase [Candidatus Calescibacterium sp.]